MTLVNLGLASVVAAAPIISEVLSSFTSSQFDLFDSSSKPLITSEELQKLIKHDALEAWANKLWDAANKSTEAEGHPTRAIGTAGHNATLDLIVDTLASLEHYYTYEVQPFVALGGRVHSWELKNAANESLASKPLGMCPPANDTSAPVKVIPNYGCLPDDYRHAEDHIVVVKRGSCPFGAKAELAGLSGATAVLLWDSAAQNSSEVFSGGDLGTPLGHQVATLGISKDLAEQVKDGDVLSLAVDSEVLEIQTFNVIAETKGGDHENVVFAGAHSDSVLDGPGINDNGSGLISLLEVAKQLSHFDVKNAVRFAWWSAEELGLKGSLYYTENLPCRDAGKIRLFLDYDMLASPNFAFEVYDSDDSENPVGSSALRDMYIDWYKSYGYNYTLQPFDGRSDYVGFIDIGIPASGVDAGVEELKSHDSKLKFGGEEGIAFDPCYHMGCDDLGNVNYEPWLVNAKLVAHSVAGYAESLAGFPERNKSCNQWKQSSFSTKYM